MRQDASPLPDLANGRPPRRARGLGVRLLFGALSAPALSACAAPGTDFEALPFYREDRTTPGVVRVDVPLLLLTVDTWPAAEPEVPRARPTPGVGGEPGPAKGSLLEAGQDAVPEPGAAPDEEREVKRDYYVRFPWPFGVWQRSGSRRNWTVTAFLLGEGLGRNAGPAGRTLSGDADVRGQPFTAASRGPATGGLASFPFVFSFTDVDHNDIPEVEGRDLDRDVQLWPFFVWGSGDRKEHEYVAIAPFGGTTRGLIGKEKMTWVGFPYPLYLSIEDRAYDSTHVLWPFYNRLEGPRHSGWRLFPFYGHYERRNRRGEPSYDKTWVMWPFFTRQSVGMDEEEPTETLFVFPFYGQIRGPMIESTTVLWPLFRHERRRLVEDEETWELRAPFPFLIVAGGTDPDRFRFDLWPLFGIKERSGFHRHFALWPIWRYEDMVGDGKTFSGQWLLPFYWRTRWEDEETGRTQHKVRGFPFFHYRSYRDGSLDVGGLSPWFFDDEGFERTLGPLFRLYRYTRDPQGGTEHQALFGLFSRRDLPELPEYGRAAYSRLSLLFGLFQYRNKGGEKALRFLWLPEFPTWGANG